MDEMNHDELPGDYAICIAGHGSRDKEGIQEFLTLSSKFKEREPRRIVECGFLEFAKPTIGEAIHKCVQDGIKNIVVIPGVLMAAGHAKNDMPSEVLSMSQKYPDINIQYGRPLEIHPKVVKVCSDRIESAEKSSSQQIQRADTLLMTVGRGSRDPDSNSNIAKISRMLWEGMGFGWATTSFIGVTQPLLPEALEKVLKMEFKRIIVFPFFLFTGVLAKRIYSIADEYQEKNPDIEILKAPYLNYDDLIVDVFMERAREIPLGLQNMNCQMCKYREQVVGFEDQVGEPQAGHHHHVRGIEGHHGLDHEHHSHDHSDHEK
jgi:sirohydrochlorin cobaltochelatase